MFVYFTAPCPEMILPPKNITVRPGGTANFTCLALSHSGIFYEWTKSDAQNLPDKSIEYTTLWTYLPMYDRITTVRILEVPNSQPANEGWYCCTANNECGNVTRCAWLEVDSKLLSCTTVVVHNRDRPCFFQTLNRTFT